MFPFNILDELVRFILVASHPSDRLREVLKNHTDLNIRRCFHDRIQIFLLAYPISTWFSVEECFRTIIGFALPTANGVLNGIFRICGSIFKLWRRMRYLPTVFINGIFNEFCWTCFHPLSHQLNHFLKEWKQCCGNSNCDTISWM